MKIAKLPDVSAYKLRERFTLFELSCLLHGNNPQQVFDVAWTGWLKRNKEFDTRFVPQPNVFLSELNLNPVRILGGDEGETLEKLKIAVGCTSIDAEYAKKLANHFGLIYPFDTELETKAENPLPNETPDEPESVWFDDNSKSVVTNETAEQRQRRRYGDCINAGLTIQSDNTYARLPAGVGKLARAEGISTAAFSKDVRLHIKRMATG